MGPTERDVDDDPVAPTARLFLRPEMNTIIHCVIAGKNPFNVDAVKSTVQNSAFLKHQRFTSLLVTDRRGREYWRDTEVDINRHVIVYDDPVGDVNDYVADLSSLSSPLNTNKPLWELHLLMAHNCAIFRVHHALVDGTSFMSMLLSCCRSAHDNSQLPQLNGVSKRNKNRDGAWKKVMALWFTLVFLVEFGARVMWLKDKRTVVSGGAGVELWPRKLATAKFRMEDMKIVKNAVAHATINDVLCGVISSGLTKYLDTRSTNALREVVQLTGVVMVNLRTQPGLQDVSDLLNNSRSTKWGNESGIFLLPFPCGKDVPDPLQYLKRAKAMIDRKKQSFEACLIYQFGCSVMNFLGSKLAGLMTHRICCNTTFAISNMVGPNEEVSIAGNPIEYIRVNTTGPQAITMHMLSYADRADMQILVAKDVIPDPQVLANCFEDALLEMKEAAQATKTLY